MRHYRILAIPCLTCFVTSCNPTAPLDNPGATVTCAAFEPTSCVPPNAPEEAPRPRPGTLDIAIEAFEFYKGSVTSLYVVARDSNGRLIDADSVQISSSNPSVVSLSGRRPMIWKDRQDGTQARGAMQTVTMVAPGSAVVRATISGVTDSIALTVRPLPELSSALAVDSFTVVEYRVACAWDCPYLAYAPLLKVREPSGKSPVYVLAVQFDISTESTGICNVGRLTLGAGFSGYIDRIDPYLWANDMVLVQLDGSPLPHGRAKARVIFRDAQGKDGLVEATAEIQRMVRDPEFPPSPFAGTEWSCAFHHGSGS